jgi:hypothetical protein
LAFEQLETVFHALDSIGAGVGGRGALAGGRIKRDRQAVGQLLAILQQLQLAFPIEAKLRVQRSRAARLTSTCCGSSP